MNKINDGGQAFPSKRRIYSAGYATNQFEPEAGMTLRDHFAGQSLIGILGLLAVGMHDSIDLEQGASQEDKLARDAYRMADAMLRARK